MQSELEKIVEAAPLSRRRFVRGLIYGTGAAGLAGCESPSLVEVPPPPPYAGRSLLVSSTGDLPFRVDRLVYDQVRQWTSRTAGSTPSRQDVGNDPVPDVSLIPARRLGRFAKGLAPVPADLRSSLHPRFFWNNLFGVYSARLGLWAAVPLAVPVAGEGQVLACRTSTLERLGKPVPQTWHEFADLALAAHAAGLGGLPTLGGDDGLEREFFTVAACYDRPALADSARGGRPLSPAEQEQAFGFQFDAAGTTCRLGRGGFVRAAALLAKMQPARSAGVEIRIDHWRRSSLGVFTVADLADFAELHAEERAAWTFAPLPGAGEVFDEATKAYAMPNGAANRVPYVGWGATLGVVSADAREPALAWEFLEELAEPGRQREVVSSPRYGAAPTRYALLEGTQRPLWFDWNLSLPQIDKVAEALRLQTGRGLLNPRYVLRIPQEAELSAILRPALKAVVEGKAEPAKALAEVAGKWQEFDPAARVAAWRAGLGL